MAGYSLGQTCNVTSLWILVRQEASTREPLIVCSRGFNCMLTLRIAMLEHCPKWRFNIVVYSLQTPFLVPMSFPLCNFLRVRSCTSRNSPTSRRRFIMSIQNVKVHWSCVHIEVKSYCRNCIFHDLQEEQI